MKTSLKSKIQNLGLRNTLILAFSCFIIIPFVTIGGTLSWLYMQSNRSMVLDAAVENNKQIVKNIDASFNPLLRLSMFPEHDPAIFQMMKKDYDALPYPLYERGEDFDTAGGIIRNSMMLYTDLLDSVAIYQSKNRIIVGRSNNEYMNHRYLETEFYREPFVQKILQKRGLVVPVGVHPERLMSTNSSPVVSIGRAVVDPYTKDILGLILLNVGIDKLKTLWSDIHFTDSTRFYLIDENQNIVYSNNPSEYGLPAAGALGQDIDFVHGEEQQTRENDMNYFIMSTSLVTGWKALTIIPKNELFGFVNTIVRTILIALLLLLGLSIIASVYIALGITKPLFILNGKMKQIAQGNMDVKIDIQQGDVGKISVTVDHMLSEIRRLIQRIYNEEQAKRKVEMLALQSQIRPHFIYNTLNVIKWMAKMQGAKGIEDALTAFSSVIRFTAKTESDFVTVNEEVEFIRSYTKILDFRYMNKFEVIFEIDPAVMEYRTLKFLLQPLVENAVFHGFDGIPYKGLLSIRIREEAGNLVMEVADNGKGMAPAQLESPEPRGTADQMNSIGIRNIRERIRLHYGEGYGLSMTSENNNGTTATIVVPVMKQEEEGEPE
ncbi:histidine kinase [Paenibacillus filicis]|uniref:Histidine kinase n=1 Tax=Paenibacillus gyeongsangnamensis TaxID=3388067 RepID=A0ABT4Q704_9BACL|nr:histidine kinase [Paenibacillus filicis]MCZ8512655.1 histidine kinase [Paenibacillus filicis]